MCRSIFQFLTLSVCLCAVASTARAQATADSPFCVERRPINAHSDLLTIFGRFDAAPDDAPLISVLFDTRGDDDPSNDEARYLWALTYAPPDFKQRAAAAIPFFYFRAGNKVQPEITEAPPPLLDLKDSRWRGLRRMLWSLLQITVLDDRGFAFRAVPRTYRRNTGEARQEQIHRALAIFSMLPTGRDDPQLLELQGRLLLSGRAIGSFVNEDALAEIARKQRGKIEAMRGRNWELLRQRAEAEGLYFEPLTMPGGGATHALLWIARQDLAANANRKFNNRFLSLDNPWRDNRLRGWRGYVETRWFDAEQRRVESQAEGAHAVELIPLALYGLDHPRIPALLVDFRDSLNPRRRELSKRLISDLVKTVFRLSPFRNAPLWAAHRIFSFIAARRGADVNQPSRLRSTAELDLLLATNQSVAPQLREEIRKRMKPLSSNPMENDWKAELELAREQYHALLTSLQKGPEK
ncbi:MAG: hypothetical protein ACREEM_12295 [Blastocatellia bacterium]